MLTEREKKVLDETHERNLKRERLKELKKDFEKYSKTGHINYAQSLNREMQKIKEELGIGD